MNRRGFLTSLGALACSATLPSIPSIPIPHVSVDFMKIAMNSMYGKFGVDRVSAYPYNLWRKRLLAAR